ncbi:hypothetical protein NT2_04_02150 [Caenibius tardaugens NBRC 16725]|uniref:HTH tetR-type domain-containing protein n=1 Tax=Caenibius tardaugens NBRC 16725 TaxID=1219035 RepID=U3A241_9SPHN|nr:TetR/AcrR family transcriptional regulator [Caenibius tardaugens]AZI36116.1 TetR/AcrR family transcriptional regulator [Caenibius tardaugens NBRC 16725]GAD48803.1 hypothetical protein NT2_04_02150 [Caenibius tardaugens NBRC 16725]
MARNTTSAVSSTDQTAVRERLLRATQDLILARGFFDANLDDIARRAGISKQTIYACFTSKQHLFEEVLRLTLSEARAEPIGDIAALPINEAVRACAHWVETAAMSANNCELYRANIAAASASPAFAADLHRQRLSSSRIGAALATHPGNKTLSSLPPHRVAAILGVLAIAGCHQLLGIAPTPDEHEARLRGMVQLFSGGWHMPVRPLSCAERPLPDTTCAITETGGRLSAARWEELLRIAAGSFSRSGIRRTSVEEIGAAAGISKMTIYKRFGNKQRLFAAALEQAVDDLLAARQPLGFTDDIHTSLATIALQEDRFAQRTDRVQLLRLLVTEAPSHPDSTHRAWARLTAPSRRELATQLAQWQAADRLHIADPLIAAEQFLLLATRGNQRLTDTLAWDENDAQTHAEDIATLFYR